MAKMIPSEFDESTASSAERKVFDLLKHDPGTAAWTVLHSLRLTRRGKKPFGEIDFVVIIPSGGVFCLEVKGGGVTCHSGVWQTRNREGEIATLKRSPFAQASDGMFALRKAVLERAPVGFPQHVIFGYAVVMPQVTFTERSTDWELWQVIDKESLRKPISVAIQRLVSEQRKLITSRAPDGDPTRAIVGTLVQMLRPDFDIVVTRGTQIEESEERLLQLTQEQYEGLDLLSDNLRCLFDGAAGTGKTMLALEFARRSAQSGLKTLFICFNRLLGDWLEREAEAAPLNDTLTAGSHFKLLREVIVRSSIGKEFLECEAAQVEGFFEKTYGDFGCLAVEELNQAYDVLVVDEAQDLLRTGILDVFGAWLKGGLAGGKWAFFGDFQRQAIFGNTTGAEMKALLLERAPHFATGRLRQNCRNTRSIGEETALLSGFDVLPYKVGQVEGISVDYRYYVSPDAERSALCEVIERLLHDGVKASDIVVLSRNRLTNSPIASAVSAAFTLVDGPKSERSRTPQVRFATIQAFKGMESPVVVLCDVTEVSDFEPQALLYVGMSRARSHLTVLIDERAKPFIRECLKRKIELWKNS